MSSYSDDVLLYIRSRPLCQILIFTLSIGAIDVTRVTLSRLNSVNAIDVRRVKCQIKDVKCQMSNITCQMSLRLNLLSERTSGVSPVLEGGWDCACSGFLQVLEKERRVFASVIKQT